ncbi:MAG TPA: ABC transporter permease [Solirubrobacteraceae bacterium]|nr:ABC transporter permease [Solirubrobacteraceae bacterium]
MRASRGASLAQAGHIARRSVLHVFRQPVPLVAAVIFPLLLLAVNVSNLHRVTRLPGFPTHSYLSFALAFVFIQGSLYIVVSAGTDLAQDIESGFLNRLALTRMSRPALVMGMLAGPIVMMLVEAVTYLLVGLASGAHIAAGVPGLLVIIGLSLLMGLAFGAVGLLLALRTGSGEVVQALLPLLFAALFMSSMSLPRGLIHTTWFREVATYNPVSYLVEAVRSLIITGWDGRALALGFGITAAIAVVALIATGLALSARVGVNMRQGRLFKVSIAVGWRAIHNYLHDPALLIPSLIFPLFFFAAFAGGLSTINNIPGFHFAAGYTAFQFVYVLLQAVIYGGVFTGVTIAMDLQSGITKRFLLAAPNRMGIVLGYVIFGVVRGLVPAAALVAVALLIGMQVSSPALTPSARAALTVKELRATQTSTRGEREPRAVPRSSGAGVTSSLKPPPAPPTLSFRFVPSSLAFRSVPASLRVRLVRPPRSTSPAPATRNVPSVPVTSSAPPAPVTSSVPSAPAPRSVTPVPVTTSAPPAPVTSSVPSAPAPRSVTPVPAPRPAPPRLTFRFVPSSLAFRSVPASLRVRLVRPPRSTSPAPVTRSVPSVPVTRSAPPAPVTSSVPPAPVTSSAPPALATRSVPPAPATRSVPSAQVTRSAPPVTSKRRLPSVTPTPARRGSGEVAIPAHAPNGVDLVGLALLVVIANIAASLGGLGLAMRIRSAQAAPLLQLTMFLALFLAPVYVPLNLISGWIHSLASINPITAMLEAGRGLLTGDPTVLVVAFVATCGLVALFSLWARRGLGHVERAA